MSTNGSGAVADGAIEAVVQRVQTAWNQGDIEAILDSYWKDGAVRFASGGQVIYGFEAVRERFLKQYPDPAVMGHLEFSDLDISRQSDTDAVVFGRWRIRRDTGSSEGLFTIQLKELDGEWLIVSDHTSGI